MGWRFSLSRRSDIPLLDARWQSAVADGQHRATDVTRAALELESRQGSDAFVGPPPAGRGEARRRRLHAWLPVSP